MGRFLVAAATSAAVALTATACGFLGFPGGGMAESPSASPSARPEAKRTPETEPPRRITPRHRAVLAHDARIASYRVVNATGGIDFRQGRVRFRLTYKVETPRVGVDELLEGVQEDFKKAGVRPRPFTVGAARGIVGEPRGYDPLTPEIGLYVLTSKPGPYGPEWGDGTYLLYAIPLGTDDGKGEQKRTVVMTLLAYAPRDTPLTAAHRTTADRLIKSVVIRERWSDTRPRREIAPIVPFSYARPPGLTGGEEIDVEGPLEVEVTFRDGVAAGKGVKVDAERLGSVRDARRLGRGTRRGALGPFDDIRAIPNLRAPAWVDEGHRVRVRLPGLESDTYWVSDGAWIFTVRARNPADYKHLPAFVASLKPARD